MKRIFFITTLLVLSAFFAQAQFLTFGVKAGLNSTSLKFDEFNVNVKEFSDIKIKPHETKFGYHFGVLARVKVLAVFIQPELLFSSVSSTINIKSSLNDNVNEIAKVKFNRIDIPILVGMKFGPARVGLGPVATFNVSSGTDAKNKFADIIKDYTKVSNTATFGGQVGVGLDILKKITLDVRYEFGLSKLTKGVKIGNTEYKTDQRQNQFLVSVGYLF